MIHTRDHKTAYMFDPWHYLGPKRRRLLDNSWAGVFREHILAELPVSRLASYYTEDFGRPTKELYAVLGALILQQTHDLSDEETVLQFSFNLQWHYALDIAGESDEAKYLSAKTLWTLRQRVMETGLDEELFNITTQTLAQVFGVDTSKQRIDSVHIRSNMRRLGRVCIFSQSIHKFLVNLKRQHKLIFDTIETELVERYLAKKALGCFSLVKPSESAKTLKTVSKDMFSLVQRFRGNNRVTSMNTFGVLLRVLKEQCQVIGDNGSCPEVILKNPGQIPSSSLQNPSDPDAGYSSHKGQGYQVQVMETYSDSEDEKKRKGTLNLITHVEVESADKSDVHALVAALESTHERGLGPEEVLADSLYGSDKNHEKAQEMEVDLIAPTMGSEKKDSLSLADFPQDEKGNITACPRGHAPVKRKQGKKGHVSIGFDSVHCNDCPLQSQCPVNKGRKRHYLRFTLKALRVAGRRAQEHTPEFKDKYRWRAGVEATFSEMATKTGIKKLRVRGMPAVGLCARLKAIGMNIFRAARVKRAREALKPDLGGALSGLGSLIYAVKEQFLSRCRRLRDIFLMADKMRRYHLSIAA